MTCDVYITPACPSPVYTCREAYQRFLLKLFHAVEGSSIRNHGAYIQSQYRWVYVYYKLHTAALGSGAEVYCNIKNTMSYATLVKKWQQRNEWYKIQILDMNIILHSIVVTFNLHKLLQKVPGIGLIHRNKQPYIYLDISFKVVPLGSDTCLPTFVSFWKLSWKPLFNTLWVLLLLLQWLPQCSWTVVLLLSTFSSRNRKKIAGRVTSLVNTVHAAKQSHCASLCSGVSSFGTKCWQR
jgi:hypothetical protein